MHVFLSIINVYPIFLCGMDHSLCLDALRMSEHGPGGEKLKFL